MEYQPPLMTRQPKREMSPGRRTRVAVLLMRVFLFSALCGLGSASAEIVDCRGAPGRVKHSIYIDEPSYAQAAFQSDQELNIFLDRLWFLLDQVRERRWLEEQDTSVQFVICHGRKPTMDGREFDSDLVKLLYNQGTILEIWSTLNARIDQGQIRDRQAQIGYLIVPLKFAEYSGQAGPSGVYFLQYPEHGTNAVADFLELFAQINDIDAFVAVALGMKSLRAGDFDMAQGNLCKAKLLLDQIESRDISSRQRRNLMELSQFVSTKLTESIRSAQSDSAYADGPLSLLDPATPCPVEGDSQ